MREGRLFAADLGASGGKCFAGIFTRDGFTLQEVHRFAHQGVSFYLPEGDGTVTERTYWDDTYLYAQVLEGLRQYRLHVADTLDGVGVDTWGSDGQLVTAGGDLLGKVYCYRDHRLDGMMDQLRQRMDPEELYRITGIHFEKFNISFQLLWLVLHRGDFLLRGAVFLPMPSLFYYYLGGVRMVDETWASVTQLLDVRSRRWSGEVCGRLGIPMDILPPVVQPGTRVGEITGSLAGELRLNRVPLFAVASHDTASAYAAVPVGEEEDALIISSGTWSLVGKILPGPIATREAMDARLSNEGGVRCIRLLTNCMGSWPVQELRRTWRERDGREMSWEEITRLVSRAEPFTAFIDTDHQNFYNPPDMQEAVAEFCRRTGQPVPNGRGAFLRVVFESLALQYRRVDRNICSVSGTRSEVVHILGGGCRNDLLNQFTADAVGLPVVAGPEEATALGNILVQAEAAGMTGSARETREAMRDACGLRKLTPRHPEAWERAYRKFLRVVSS
jgi:rhamnulokinase